MSRRRKRCAWSISALELCLGWLLLAAHLCQVSANVQVGSAASDNEQVQQARRFSKRSHERYSNLLVPSPSQQRRTVTPAAQTPQQQSPEQPPGELLFSNNTGAIVQCGVALDLAKSIARVEAASGAREPQQRAPNDIQVRWLKESGDEVEQVLYAEPPIEGGGPQSANQQRPLRFVRTSDGALVFEPFRVADFRPDVHASTYRCVAWSSSRGASLVSRDMRVRAALNMAAANHLEVLDELALEGGTALFRCQVASFAQDYLQVVDWVEYPGETVLSYQSTTQAHASHLFANPSHNVQRSTEQQQNQSSAAHQRYFVAPRSGDLHIMNVDASLNYHQYRCRCKNKLTGELLSSVNKGKLIVTDVNSPLVPRLSIEGAGVAPSGAPLVQEEGELVLLACNLQAFGPRVQVSWSRVSGSSSGSSNNRIGSDADGWEPIEGSGLAAGFAQVANLLLINRAQRNHSGRYLCQAKSALGEERLEMDLLVRAPLRAKLSASGNVLELGKSLALECSVTGFPIHQVVFRHNQNVIKSISGAAAASSTSQQQQQQLAPGGSSYFVVDSGAGSEAAGSGELGGPASGQPSTEDSPGAPSQSQVTQIQAQVANQIKLSHVIVIVLEPQHAGAYQCFAHNQYESVQSSAYIRVLDDPPKFKETFRAQVFEQRQDVSLQCAARANPLPEITWSVDGQPVGESGRARFGDFVTKDNLVISYVNISQTQVADSGLYRCTADNGLAQVSHQAQISVLGPLQVKPMAKSTVLASTSFRIRCPVAGHPVAEVQWQHNGRRLPANHRQHVYENGTLEVEHMERSAGDDGEYTCLASSGNADPPAQGSIQVSIKARPTIEPFSISRSLREGQRASVMCTISSGDLPISISWFRNDQPLVETAPDGQVLALPASSLQQVASLASPAQLLNGSVLANVRISRVSDYSSTLLFESLLVHHSANYTCLARNEAGSVSHQANMVVQVAPKWSIEPSDTSVVRGASLSIDCMAAGFPPPRVIWTKALVEPTSGGPAGAQKDARSHLGSWRSIVSSPHLQVHENGSLNVLDARDSDFGHYMCQAANGVGPGLSKVIKVTVNVAAQFNMRHSVQYVSKGEQTHLKCQAKGDWPLVIHWFKNKSRLEPMNAAQETSGQQRQSEASVLQLASSAPPASATLAHLQLQALRSGGSVMEQLNEVLLMASGSQSPQALSAGKQQPGGGLLLARYSLGQSEQALNRDALSAGRAGGGVAGPQQQLEPAGRAQPPLLVQVSSVLSVDQAERQDTSTFRCIAANHFGLDERVIQLVVQEPPERVDELSVLETSSRSIALAWLAPHDGNTPITHYHVHYRQALASADQAEPVWLNLTLAAGESQQQLQATSAGASKGLAGPNALAPAGRTLVKVAIGALKPMTHYWFSVEAENKLGLGPRSPVLESRTVEEAPGAAPSKLKAASQSSSSILVSWSKLQEKEVYGPVHGYYVAYKPLSDQPSSATNKSLDEQAANSPVVNTYKTVQHEEQLNKFDALLTGLRRSTRYMISVQAFNARGAGPSSEPIVVRTLDMDPPRQVKLFVKQASNCSIQLEWRPLSQAALQQLAQSKQVASAESAKSSMLPMAMPFQAVSGEPLPAHGAGLNQADQVDYYSLFQAELNERPQWQEIRVAGHATSHTLDQLRCGTRYQFYMMGVNRIGMGEQSDILDTKTAGGLPVAPDRQSTFDVINTTCYLIRLDHWQDNGCPIQEFYVRYRAEAARDWTQLAHLNLTEAAEAGALGEGPKGSRMTPVPNAPLRGSSRLNSDSNRLWSVLRVKRSMLMDGEGKFEDTYLFNGDESRDEEDSFFDYLPADGSLASGDVADYPAESATNLTEVMAKPEQSSQLFSLLKDSMLPAFEADELVQPRLERLPTPAQEWQASNFAESAVATESTGRAAAGRLSEQEQPEHVTARTAHATRMASSPQDWRRVRLCNLVENVYYTIQITAANSVGETDAELRLLTSQEGLEYDQEVKRQVVGKLGGDRMAQHSLALGESFNLTALSHWPLLLPLTLFIAFICAMIVVVLLVRRGSNAPGSTSTTTTMSPSNHCQNYLNDTLASQHQHQSDTYRRGGGGPHSLVELGGSVADSYTLANHGLVEGCANNPNMAIYQQHHSDHSVFEEPSYGVVGMGRLMNGGPVSNSTGNPSELANRSSSSPATTAIGSSLNSGSTGGQFSLANVFLPGQQQQQQQQDSLARVRGAYLCTKEESGTKPETIFYGITSNPQQATMYAAQQAVPATVQLRHFQQHPDDFGELVSKEPSSNNYETANKQQTIFQPTNNLYVSNDNQHETGEGGKLDNCFLNIVEEVARANDSLSQQRLLQNANKAPDSVEQEASGGQCNQAECCNHLIQATNLNYSPNTGGGARQEVNKELHHDNQLAGRLMFDPVYATIRRTFPQAFKYLTLQQHHGQNQANSMLRSSPINQQLVCQQRNEESVLDHLERQRQQQQQQSNVSHNMSMFDTSNLAALNLLTPSTNLQQQSNNIDTSQQ